MMCENCLVARQKSARAQWEAVRVLIDGALADQHRPRPKDAPTPAQVAERLDLLDVYTAEAVRDWRSGRRRPPIELLPELAVILGLAPFAFAEALGLVGERERRAVEPTDLAMALVRVRELEDRVRRLTEDQADVLRRTAVGAALLAARAHETKRWAVAVWPAIEGPPDCRLHVADRISIRRCDGEPFDHNDLVRDLGSILRRVSAVEVRANFQAGWPRGVDDSSEGRWSIPLLTGPRPPLPGGLLDSALSIAVVSHTLRAWSSDVAAHIATALGYGLTSTRDLVHILDEVWLSSGEPLNRQVNRDRRRDLFRELLARPQVHYVWYHFDMEADNPLVAGIERQLRTMGQVVVRLREDDALLEYASAWLPAVLSGEESRDVVLAKAWSARADVDRAIVSETSSTIVQLDVKLPDGVDISVPPNSAQFREGCFDRSLWLALAVLTQLEDVGHPSSWPPSEFQRWAGSRWTEQPIE